MSTWQPYKVRRIFDATASRASPRWSPFPKPASTFCGGANSAQAKGDGVFGNPAARSHPLFNQATRLISHERALEKGRKAFLKVGALCLISVGMAPAAHAQTGSLRIDPDRIAIAGFSSGALLATQAQLAYPELFSRAALVAGGPYGCGSSTSGEAVDIMRCMYPAVLDKTYVDGLVDLAAARARQGLNGPLSKLANGTAYVLYGSEDAIVGPNVEAWTAYFYRRLRDSYGLINFRVVEDHGRVFAHTFPVDVDYPGLNDCHVDESPYISNCHFDAALAIFSTLYPDVPAPASPSNIGAFTVYDSSALARTKVDPKLGRTYLYTPKACMHGQSCGLLVVLHGCKQNYDSIGETFIRDSGFTRWANDYKVAVLYPQVESTDGNFGGCWDWWGYTGDAFATREGAQLKWLATVVHKLAATDP